LPGTPKPPSLINIFKELKGDLGIAPPTDGYLKDWATQGVLLLNAVLTVRQGQAGSHQDIGWERFTDEVIYLLNKQSKPLVFILWGAYAKTKKRFLKNPNHLILQGNHPSPLSANRGGFFGGKYFSKTNEYLESNKLDPINWQL
jgi:uracil-DNA glycosylase